MNKYLRAVGFTKPPRRRDIYNIIESGLENPASRSYATNEDEEDALLAQFDIAFGKRIGLTVYGQFDERDEFFPDYYYPYLDSMIISSTEELSVDERVDNDTYAGICDDIRIGAALIFRLRNAVEYRRNTHTSYLPLANTSVTLTALSLEGTVLLPVYKNAEELRQKKETDRRRRRLLNAARSGDESAARDLTVEEMVIYSNLISRIAYDDIYTLVDSYFMPYGAECELYAVMGEIVSCEEELNHITGEMIWIIQVKCNGLPIDIAINREDLYGDPKAGRRFKGVIWLQGKINFPLQTNADNSAD